MGRGNRKKKKNGARSVVPHQPFSTTIAPATLNQQSLSLSQQNTVILSPNATISELQSINAFNESDKEWVKAYIEKEQAHRHALEDVREQNRKDSDDRLIQIAGRSQMIGAFGGVIVTLGLAGAAVYFVSKGWNVAAVGAVLSALLPFATAFFGRRNKDKSDSGKQ
ncbi:hypothetical protein [uncultured Akkermansia sp.]|jgi:uncharacterized membrane protein|uniref:hypothetical protein n=1 Tax=uncultured Akkermansia sp. TaxID=512294 RepID=UPI002601D858|nr:hypothetical protein [uncultured Akkermansia sp.]